MRAMALQQQQQFRPLGHVAGLEAPRAEHITAVVAVVFPVDTPVGVVMLPDPAVGQRCLALGDVVRQQFGATQIAFFAGGFKCSDQRLAAVHVGVLSTVRRYKAIGCRFVGVQAVGFRPEQFFHQFEGGADTGGCFVDADAQRVGMRQQYKCQAIAMLGAIDSDIVFQHPGVTAVRWLPMPFL